MVAVLHLEMEHHQRALQYMLFMYSETEKLVWKVTMQRISSLVLVALVGCGAKESTTCPEGTTSQVHEGRNAPKRRICLLDDGITVHGPIVEILPDGTERIVGRVNRGLREGKFVENDPLVGMTTEAVYKGGLVDGVYSIRRANGQPFVEQQFRAGHPHGVRKQWLADGAVKSIEHYENGKPTGTWHDGRAYGADGVLVSVEGRAVASPPAQLSLPDGSTLTRLECVRRAEAFVWDGAHLSPEPLCLDVFEQVQLCGDDEVCRQGAIAEFAKLR